MAEAPAGGAGAKLDPQAAIAKHAAITQSGAGGDAGIIARIENAIKNSPMGWLQQQLGEVDSRAASEKGEVGGKVQEHQQLVASNAKDQPKDAGPPPALGPATHPAVAHPASAGDKGAAPAAHPAPAAGAAAAHPTHPVSAPPKSAPAAAPTASHGPTIAASIAGAGGDSQLDAILNAYTPKGQQSTQMVGRVKQMGDIAQGFNGQLDVYVAQGGAVEHGIAAASNFFGMGKDVSAVWANNPYRKVHGILGGIMTGLSAVKNVCGVVGSICGKLGLVLTVIGLLGMIFPPIGAAVSGIARILNVVGVICDAVSFVLSGILTGLNGVVLAQQINAGASAEEKAATADLMMSEANETASGFVNLAMMFGPKFMKGMLGNSKGIIGSLMRRAKATIGRISLKLTADVKHFANRITRRLGFGGASMSRVGGAWKDTGFFARTKERFAQSSTGKTFYGAPKHLEAVQEKLMAKYGNTGWAKKLDRMGAWSGSVASKFDLEEKVGKLGEKSGKWVGGVGADTKFGKSMAAAADRSERQTRELAMKMDARNAADLEKSRWHNYLDKRQSDNPEHLRDKKTEKDFIHGQGEKVKEEHRATFEKSEQQREAKERLEGLRDERFERKNKEYYANEHGERDEIMNNVHSRREKRYQLEGQFATQETERKTLLGKTTKTAEDQTRLTQLNGELRGLDEARRQNRMYETELQGLAGGGPRVRKPEYKDWGDVGINVADAAEPLAEMLHLKEEDRAWAAAEKSSIKKQARYSKGSAQGNAAGRGGHGTFEEIASEGRHEQMADFTQFVRSNQQASTVTSKTRGMLSGVLGAKAPEPKPPAPAAAPAAAAVATPAASPTVAAPVTATPAAPAHAPQGGVAVGPGAAHAPGAGNDNTVALAASVHEEPPVAAPVAGPQAAAGGAGGDDNAAEVLPYWPALVPEFDKASHDFDWMRRVAVEFKKAQIDGKQKAVDTLAVYGRYQEYAKLRADAAAKNKEGAGQTGTAIQQNVDHAGQTQAQAGQGEAKQTEAKGAASNKAATDLPEPESRGFWGRILGAVKRWAKNKAAQVFGWIQEKISSLILKGLCGVSMGDMREYAGALRRQQASAHGVADGAGKTSAQAQQSQIKLSADATKEAQGAADAIGECDRNITDADSFMGDIASFEQQLAEEKAHAQAFIAQIHAATHAEQARQQQEQAAQAQEEQKHKQMSAGAQEHEHAPAAAPAAEPTPTPVAAAAGAPHEEPHHEDKHADADAAANGEIHAAAGYVGTEGEAMVSRVDARADDYQNQLAIALTNHTGKDKSGTDLKGPSKTESKHIVEEFKEFTTATKHTMDGFTSMSIDPSQARHIADTIVQSAEQLEHNFGHSQAALDELFERTYNGIREGKRTLKSQLLDGDNAVGHINHMGDKVTNQVIDTTLPAANNAWNTVAAPIQTPAAPAPAPAPAAAATAAPVQRKSTGEATTDNVGDVAAQGVSSAGSALPHLGRIQASFGKHDVSGVRAQVGGDAAHAAQHLGASAYAQGDKVGFAAQPDLHTAAHEATHIVQQRQGVSLKGGVDSGNSDPHEQQADAVADKVVRGESAEALLDGGAGGAGGAAVQRKSEANETSILVDAGPLAPGQMLKQVFLDELKPHIVEAANAELGRLGSAVGCPYIAQYFAKYAALPAESTVALLRKWVPASAGVTSAKALAPLILERVLAGVRFWKQSGGKLPPDLIAAEPAIAAASNAAAHAPVQRKSLDAMEAQLGAGEAVDQKAAAPFGAGSARVHRGPQAEQMAADEGAVAFAAGENVVMGANAPKQGTVAGDALLAHELAHTAQQKDAAKDPTERAKPMGGEQQAAETNADKAAGGALANQNLAGFNSFASYASDVMRTNVQLQRCSTEAASASKDVDFKQYFEHHDMEIAATAADQIATLPFATGDAAVKWTADGNKKFAQALAVQIKSGDAKITDIIKPENIVTLVDQSRVMSMQTTKDAFGEEHTEPTMKGPDRYFEGVGLSLANAVARRTTESLKREVPRYAQAKLHSSGEPSPGNLLVSHPIDPLVVTALVVGGVLEIDKAAFNKEHPDLVGAPVPQAAIPASALVPEPTHIGWYRLNLPQPATPEQIAVALFKDPAQAFRVDVAHPLYGVREADGADTHMLAFQGKGGDAFSEEVGLNQANALGLPAKNPPAAVIQQIRMNATLIKTSIKAAAEQLGIPGGGLDALGARLLARASKLETGANPAEAKKWDVQSMAQSVIIKQGARGLEAGLQRVRTYSMQFGATGRPEKLPEENQAALHQDADLWTEAIEASDMPTTADHMLHVAAQHSATLEIDIMESTLAAPQAAADSPNSDKDSATNKDFHPEQLGPREVALRQKLGQMRAQVLADPSKLNTSADQTAQDTRELVFEANVVMQAEQVDQAWRILDDASGFWAHVTFESGKLNKLKARGKGYYGQWQEVFTLIKAKKNEDARKKYEALCRNIEFQHFLRDVQDAVQEAAQRALIAKLIGMIVIMVVSMGVGTIVEGLVGGGAVVAGAVEGGEAVSAVTTGLGMGRTAGAVAGFIAETGSYSLMSNLMFSKDHSVTAMLTEFGKNIVLFGAMRGIGKAFEAAGMAKAVALAGKEGASVGAVVKAGAWQLSELVANGGVAVLASVIEAKIEAATKGQQFTDDQLGDIIKQNVIQTIVMVIVGRISKPFFQKLQIKAAYQGSKWRMAIEAHRALADLAHPMEAKAGKGITEAQLHEVLAKDFAELQAEHAAFEEVRDKMVSDKADTTDVDKHLAELDKHEQTTKTTMLMAGLKRESSNHFLARPDDIPMLKAQHEKLGHRFEEVPTQEGQPRTFVATDIETNEQWFISEDPAFAKDSRPTPRAAPKAPLTTAESKLITSKVSQKAPPKHIGDTVDDSYLTEEQMDIERWQSHGLEDAAGDASNRDHEAAKGLLADPQFRHWYDVWMSMPDRITVDAEGVVKVKRPPGMPAKYGPALDTIGAKGNSGMMTRALDVSKRIEAEFPGLDTDPNSTAWKQARPKLVEILGEAQVKKYENERTKGEDPAQREIMDKRMGEIVAPGELQHISELMPGAKVYVTGSAAQTKKSVKDVADLDLIVVVPRNTPQKARIELEGRLQGMTVERPNGGGKMPIDAKVMTEEQFMGLAMSKTPAAENRSAMPNYRVDTPVDQVPGTGESGGDLHNHVMGVPATQYFIDKVGNGNARVTLEKLMQDIAADPKLQAEVKPNVMKILRDGLSDVHQAQQAGMPPDVVDARARRALDNVLSANEHTPFDHTYDIRDILVTKHIDAGNTNFENYAHDVLTDLHDQGVTYSEQSVSQKKLDTKFTPEAMDAAHKRAQAEGKDTDMKFLVMAPTDKTLAQPDTPAPTDPAAQKAAGEAKTKADDALKKTLMRPDVTGMDVAGPEKQPFTKSGMAWLVDRYRLLEGVAKAKGQRLVLRPHVGEGYSHDAVAGSSDAKAANQVAENNLRMLVETLKGLGYNGSGDVIVRLGHATHASPETLRMMADAGIIVEANVGSNIATGSVLTGEDHPLLKNMYYGVKTILSTDGQGVMGTQLPAEYQRAALLINDFRGGKKLEVEPGKEIEFGKLDKATQDRFSIKWLTDQLDQYKTDLDKPVHQPAKPADQTKP